MAAKDRESEETSVGVKSKNRRSEQVYVGGWEYHQLFNLKGVALSLSVKLKIPTFLDKRKMSKRLSSNVT